MTPSSPAPWKATANFVREGTSGFTGPNSATTTIDMSFPKGDALAQWLANVGASSTKGQVTVADLRYNVQTHNAPSTRWVSGQTSSGNPALFFYTFNTPVEETNADNQCGKVLFSDFHVAGSSSGSTFPAECSANAMTNQQKALEFMLFDLSSCIQKEADPPARPIPH